MIRGDSTEYELLVKWCETSPYANQEGSISCEIGVREGMGTKIILDHLKPQVHIGIDPYGNLKYQHYDTSPAYTCDYTDDMYHQMMQDFAEYKNFQMYKMTDIDFMKRFNYLDGYCFVHFDGPHMTKDVIREAIYFADKAIDHARFIFDDYPKYNMSKICDLLAYWDFKVLEKGENKICLEKQKLK
jgi:hypothetical protein